MKILAFCPTTKRLNSETVNRILRQEDVEHFDKWFTFDNPYDEGTNKVYLNIQINYEKMREVVLSQGYQKVWVVEEDIIPPFDALKKLLEVDAPIVSGLYMLRRVPNPNMMRYTDLPSFNGLLSFDEMKASWGKTIPISGGCMGCLLIDRSVLEKFSFRLVDQQPIPPDMPLMNFCCENKIPQMGRLDVVCGHAKLNENILYPDANEASGYREVQNA